MKTETIMKLSAVIASSLLLTTLANAAVVGSYAGIGLGGSNNNANTLFFKNSSNWTRTSGYTLTPKPAGKLFAGYNFNQHIGLEASYGVVYASVTNKYVDGSTVASSTYSMNAASLVGKIYLPIEQGFNLYALGGGSKVSSKVQNRNNNVNAITINNDPSLQNGSKTTHLFRPVYGIGATYDANTQVTTGLEFSRIQGKGDTRTSATAIPSANLLTLTAAYNFG
jgi:hypothetical protein